MIQQNAPTPRLFRRLAAIAILASTAIAAPALACQNPSFAQRGAGLAAEPATLAVPASDAADPSFNDALVQATRLLDVDRGHVAYDFAARQRQRAGLRRSPRAIPRRRDRALISNGLPPALGNICIGIWKRVGTRSYKLRHMTWNWSPPDGGFGVPGTFAGHFELEVDFDLDPNGRTFRGRWSAKNYDPSGEHLPELDADGVIRGVRLTVD